MAPAWVATTKQVEILQRGGHKPADFKGKPGPQIARMVAEVLAKEKQQKKKLPR